MAENEYKENDGYFDADMGDGFAIKLLSAKDRFALYWDAPKDFMSNLKQIINNEEGDLAEKKLKLGKIKEVESKVGELQGKKVLAKSEEEKKQLDEAIAGFFVSDIDQIAVESAMSVIQRMKGQKEEGQNKWDYIKNTKTDGKRRYGLSDEGVERIENFLFENSANQPAPVNAPQPQPQPQPVPQPQPQPAPVPQPQPQPSPAPNPTPVPNVMMVEEPDFAKDYRLSDDLKDRVDANNKGATLAAIIEAFANAKTPEDAFQAAFIAAILYLPNKLAWGIELAAAREKEKNEYIKKEIESYDNLIAGSKGLNDSDRIYSVHKEFFDACGDLCVAAANLKKTHPELLDGLDIQFDANGKVTGDVPDILRERILQRGYFDTYGHMPTVDKLKELQKQSITLQNSGMYAKERSSQPTPVPQPAPTPQPQPNPAPQPQPVPKVQDNVTVNVNGKEMSLKENVDVLLTVKAKDLQLEYADYVTLKTAYQTKAQAIQKNRADLNNAKMGINLTIKDKQFPNQKGFTREAYEV